MTDLPKSCDAVVVGAGAAGLVAAADLAAAGLDVTLVEAEESVGGRVRSTVRDGYVLDRGFQVLNTAYPAVRRRLDLDALRLRAFPKGMAVRTDRGLLRLRASPAGALSALSLLSGTLVRPSDLFRLLGIAAGNALEPASRLKARPETDTLTALRRRGLGRRAVDTLVRPFLSGVFLDPSLGTSSRADDLVWRSFARGRLTVPGAGIQAVPDQLAARAAGARILTGVPVRSVAPGEVRTEAGTVRCRAVVVAVGPGAVHRLLPALPAPVLNPATTYYHSRPAAPGDDALLHVDGRSSPGPLSSVMVLTATAPSYAPPGRALIASSAVGDRRPSAADAGAEAARILGTRSGDWEHLETVHIPDALPAAPPPLGDLRRPVALGDGLYVAGDHRDTPSLQGALVSGERAAAAVLADLAGA
ncbi:FAD-dependent oxidoreductase [Nocardiopsis flavescens]|uniref:Phytoene dehydrogenase-related protein n=2 Tax=Nocardiopsis flavescens TaxID=758803 RepID=A0A1M6LRT6_9ACTN|nr:FAD-dependent oxidoreductase [Nocardiopsis flavescens]SHJ73919.1 Phytoene dehydrogenase-related protein [Nocardiopsis flavescens]